MDHQEEQRNLRNSMKNAWALTPDGLDWHPYYPNNMPQNGQEGWYCVIQEGDHARKYTIRFQYPEDEDGLSHPEQGVDRYILFEKNYYDLEGPLICPEPDPDPDLFEEDGGSLDVNDFGLFIYAHPTLERAKAGAVRQWQAVFGYAASFLLDPEEETE